MTADKRPTGITFTLDVSDLPKGMLVDLVRKIQGITKKKLCELAGITPPTLKSLIDGKEVNLNTVFECFKALDIRITYVRNGEPVEVAGNTSGDYFTTTTTQDGGLREPVEDLGDDPYDYGTILKKLRSMSSLAQNTLAGEAEIQILTITNLEKKGGARWANYVRALEALGINLLVSYKYKQDELKKSKKN